MNRIINDTNQIENIKARIAQILNQIHELNMQYDLLQDKQEKLNNSIQIENLENELTEIESDLKNNYFDNSYLFKTILLSKAFQNKAKVGYEPSLQLLHNKVNNMETMIQKLFYFITDKSIVDNIQKQNWMMQESNAAQYYDSNNQNNYLVEDNSNYNQDYYHQEENLDNNYYYPEPFQQ